MIELNIIRQLFWTKEHVSSVMGILEMIKARYPDDLATGFTLNDFRGAWKITFTK